MTASANKCVMEIGVAAWRRRPEGGKTRQIGF
jgi:hypothetical protein